jgi:hypothetical protein
MLKGLLKNTNIAINDIDMGNIGLYQINFAGEMFLW